MSSEVDIATLLARMDRFEKQSTAMVEHLYHQVELANQNRSSSANAIRPLLESVSADLASRLEHLNTRQEVILQTAMLTRRLDLDLSDLRADVHALFNQGPIPACGIKVECEKPVAIDSADHLNPRGTAQDNTRHPVFVTAIDRLIGRSCRFLDLGCSGGGLVYDMARAGHQAVGVEGSDYSLRHRRAEWATIPDRLFTGDITAPMKATTLAGDPVTFEVITAWEVLEHLPEETLPGFFANLKSLLHEDGWFIASVALMSDRHPDTDVELHVTRKPREWWNEQITAAGLVACDTPLSHEEHARGSGNLRAFDWDAQKSPELGFHLAIRRA